MLSESSVNTTAVITSCAHAELYLPQIPLDEQSPCGMKSTRSYSSAESQGILQQYSHACVPTIALQLNHRESCTNIHMRVYLQSSFSWNTGNPAAIFTCVCTYNRPSAESQGILHQYSHACVYLQSSFSWITGNPAAIFTCVCTYNRPSPESQGILQQYSHVCVYLQSSFSWITGNPAAIFTCVCTYNRPSAESQGILHQYSHACVPTIALQLNHRESCSNIHMCVCTYNRPSAESQGILHQYSHACVPTIALQLNHRESCTNIHMRVYLQSSFSWITGNPAAIFTCVCTYNRPSAESQGILQQYSHACVPTIVLQLNHRESCSNIHMRVYLQSPFSWITGNPAPIFTCVCTYNRPSAESQGILQQYSHACVPTIVLQLKHRESCSNIHMRVYLQSSFSWITGNPAAIFTCVCTYNRPSAESQGILHQYSHACVPTIVLQLNHRESCTNIHMRVYLQSSFSWITGNPAAIFTCVCTYNRPSAESQGILHQYSHACVPTIALQLNHRESCTNIHMRVYLQSSFSWITGNPAAIFTCVCTYNRPSAESQGILHQYSHACVPTIALQLNHRESCTNIHMRVYLQSPFSWITGNPAPIFTCVCTYNRPSAESQGILQQYSHVCVPTIALQLNHRESCSNVHMRVYLQSPFSWITGNPAAIFTCVCTYNRPSAESQGILQQYSHLCVPTIAL